MKKFFFIMSIASILSLSGCIVTDDSDEYKRMNFQTSEDISEIIATDISTDYTVQISDNNDVIVEYSNSPTKSWYNIDVSEGILKIEKTRGTVGVEDSSVNILLPEKEYKNISIETTNGDILFDNVSFLRYKCFTENGDITGTLNGNEADYLIVTKTKNGDNNLKDNVIDSSKTIEFNVKNGDVNIDFTN